MASKPKRANQVRKGSSGSRDVEDGQKGTGREALGKDDELVIVSDPIDQDYGSDPTDQDDGPIVLSEEVTRLVDAVSERMAATAGSREDEIAEVFARLLDCDEVDEVFGLPTGTTARLAQDPSFIDHAADVRLERSQRAGPDFGAVLEPIQREAAWLLAVEKLDQTEIAKRLGVSRRTIYNWLQLNAFKEYMRTLEEREMERRNAAYYAAQDEASWAVADLKSIAMRKAKELAEEGNVRLISRVVDKLLK